MDDLKKLQENGKIATIDPMLTGAAAKSDVWLAPKPGTDGALASAIAHHLLVEGSWSYVLKARGFNHNHSHSQFRTN